MIPGADGSGDPFTDVETANTAAAAWCVQVNATMHSEICAVPAERLIIERELLAPLPSLRASIGRSVTRKVDRLACVRFGVGALLGPGAVDRPAGPPARRSRPNTVDHAGPGEGAAGGRAPAGRARARHRSHDDHYGGPRPAPRRAVRPKTVAEKTFCALGPTAEAFITGAAAAGNTRLGPELIELNTLAAAHGTQVFIDALGPGGRVRSLAGRRRAVHPRRRHRNTPTHHRRRRPGARAAPSPDPLTVGLRAVGLRPARHHARHVMNMAPPALAPDLVDGLRRLKLAAMRQLAPELLRTAKTQRWAPEELLRTLVEAEIAARDASNARTRLKTAAFPVIKTLDEFDRTVSSIPAATLDYLTSLEWINARENLCLVGPAGTGKSHLLVALGVAAVGAGHRVRYFTAADLVETLYRGLADNSVGRVIDTLLRNDLLICDEVGFAPLDDTGAQLLFRFIAAAYERRALGIASHWPFEAWGRFLPEHTTAVSLLDRLLHHANVVVTDGESHRMREARNRQPGAAKKT